MPVERLIEKGGTLQELERNGTLASGRYLIDGNTSQTRVDSKTLGVTAVSNTKGRQNSDFLLVDNNITVNGRKCTLLGVYDGPYGIPETAEAARIAGEETRAYAAQNQKGITNPALLLAFAHENAHNVLCEKNESEAKTEFKTTGVAAIIDWEANKAYVVHSGNSRAYLIREGCVQQITRDHGEFEGVWSFMGKRGGYEVGMYEVTDFNPKTDGILLCTDGLHNTIAGKDAYLKKDFQRQAERIGEVIFSKDHAQEKVGALKAEAITGGSMDDITAVLCSRAELNPLPPHKGVFTR